MFSISNKKDRLPTIEFSRGTVENILLAVFLCEDNGITCICYVGNKVTFSTFSLGIFCHIFCKTLYLYAKYWILVFFYSFIN